MVVDDNVWLTQDMIAILYDKARSAIAEHLQELFSTGEIDEIATCRKFRQVQCKCSNDTALRDIQDLIGKNILQRTNEGGRSVNYELHLSEFLTRK